MRARHIFILFFYLFKGNKSDLVEEAMAYFWWFTFLMHHTKI